MVTETPITPAQFEERMRTIEKGLAGDPEPRHRHFDCCLIETLRSLGYGAGCDIYEAAEKWYA